MSDESHRFRKRAEQCRFLASEARDEESRRTLTEMADDLCAEADKIDSEDAGASLDPDGLVTVARTIRTI